ncbi:hypothetical protein GCM10012275_24040 [Longimycelium tulufanense]|uniref:DUF1259 domain-containing protein n=1 Tax=Longimycelium tulufanense TaxID=907463 RepID=A0A8J3C7X3_9PSEU|nr:DUF1259 domain-containing protein [Longimycelium tulufanense]GGM52271.1 hypothetical protein GCM10012275_24040 [Longimycelium tulufanense]
MSRGHAGRLLGTIAAAAVMLAGCADGGDGPAGGTGTGHRDKLPAGQQRGQDPVQTSEDDWKGVAEALGRAGKMSGDTVYRVGFPRSDLNLVSRGMPIKAGFALGSYAVFARYPDGKNIAMGDLVVTEEELPKVTDALQARGIAQTAVHKHLLAHEPDVWWTHFHAEDNDAAKVAKGLREALDATATPPPGDPAPDEPIDLDTKAIDEAMGTQGRNDGGIYKFSFRRKETITAHDKVLPPGMGVTTAINFQPTGGGRAAVNGDFAMTAKEVQDVIQALRSGGIEVVELHNHSLSDEPRLFYMHFWASDDAAALARTLRQAVDKQDVEPTG